MKKTPLIMAIIGALLIGCAFYSAEHIPTKANADFYEFARSQPMNNPGFPEAFMQMHAQRRLLQNFYLGGVGLVLLFVGASTLCRDRGLAKGDKA
jgi:hypothetical protein